MTYPFVDGSTTEHGYWCWKIPPAPFQGGEQQFRMPYSDRKHQQRGKDTVILPLEKGAGGIFNINNHVLQLLCLWTIPKMGKLFDLES